MFTIALQHGRSRSIIIGIAVAACLFAASRLVSQNNDARPPAATVEMIGVEYRPAKITIRVGEAVEWKNNSWFTQTVTGEPALADDKKDVGLPGGATPFHSGDILKNETYRHTFTVPGTYRYFSVPFENKGMVGEVTVEQ